MTVKPLPRGWAWAMPPELQASERYSLAIGPFGSNLKVSDYTASGTPLVFVRNVRAERFDGDDGRFVSAQKARELAAHQVAPGDVLITKMGDPPGDSALYPTSRPPGIITADCIRWRLAPEAGQPRFFVYAIRTWAVREQIMRITRGVAQRKMSLARFRTLRVPVAPVPEQRRIVASLDSYFSRLDVAMANLERVQRNLERYRASVLKAAVEGRLVPTEAELARAEGRDHEPASVLLERILGQRLREWQEHDAAGSGNRARARRSEIERERRDHATLPALPEGWCWSSVGQLGVVSGGITKNSTRERLPLQLPYLRVANVYANELRLDEVKRIGVSEPEARRTELAPGDLLIVEGNGSVEQIGRVALWNGRIERCVHQNHLIRVRFSPVALADWVLTWLLSPAGRVAIEQVASSTSGLHTLSISKVAKLPVPLPPAAEQVRVLAEVDLLLTLDRAWASSVAGSVSRCRAARQSILRWAFEGVLVDQDPHEEPAPVVLGRIAESRGAKGPDGRRRRRREVGSR